MSWMAHSDVSSLSLDHSARPFQANFAHLKTEIQKFLSEAIFYLPAKPTQKKDGSNPPKARKTEARTSLIKEQQQLENNAWKTSPIAACLIQQSVIYMACNAQ